MNSRRGFLTNTLSFLAAPAIVKVSSLMPISTNVSKGILVAPGVYVTEVDYSDIINVQDNNIIFGLQLKRLQSVKGSTSL